MWRRSVSWNDSKRYLRRPLWLSLGSQVGSSYLLAKSVASGIVAIEARGERPGQVCVGEMKQLLRKLVEHPSEIDSYLRSAAGAMGGLRESAAVTAPRVERASVEQPK